MENRGSQKSWFGRNWIWVVPTGGCLTLIILFIVFIGATVFGVSKLITESGPYQEAIEKVNNDDYVIKQLGSPIESTGIPSGNISLQNDEGSASFSIPIEGPKGTAKLYVTGTKLQNTWEYSEVYLIISDTGEEIDLINNTSTLESIE